MAGFPIVSLGCVVGVFNKCNVLMPQFEVDQYYQGDEEQAIQCYKKRYPTAVSLDYIINFNVEQNNIDLTSGVLSRFSSSMGLSLYQQNNQYYSNNTKLQNIYLYRLDCFYVISIDSVSLNGFMLKLNTNYIYPNYVSIYVNLPNITDLGSTNGFSSGSKVKEVYINAPKVDEISSRLLAYNTTITDLYMNAPNFKQSSGALHLEDTNKGETKGIYLHSLTTSDINRLYTLIYNNRNTSTATNLYKGTTCTYSDFDVRYWNEEQNNTGSDR